MTAAPTTHAPPSALRWLHVGAVALGIFLIVTVEILPIGLLTAIGRDIAVTDGTAGLMITVPGFVAAAAAPLVALTSHRLPRRRVLMLLMVLLSFSNVLVALAPGLEVLLVSRVLVGVVIGGFWSLGVGLADRLVPTGERTRANAVIFSAVPLGSVLGVPLGTFLGQVTSWRTTFAVLAVCSAAVALSLSMLPVLPRAGSTSLHTLSGALRRVPVRRAIMLTFLVVLAHFGTYTYVVPFLELVTGTSPSATAALLLGYGICGLLGNYGATAFLPAWPVAGFATCAAALGGSLLVLAWLGVSPAPAVAALLVWGLAYGGVPVLSQAMFLRGEANPEVATVLFTASFQLTISVGALLGGRLVDLTSPAVLMLLGGTVALLGVLLCARPAQQTCQRG